MDCRRSFWLFLALALGSGCVTTSNKTPPPPPAEPPPPLTASKDKKVVKQQPKPDTCVTFGQCFENLAAEADQSGEMKIRDKARVAYQQALQLDAKNIEAWLGLGRVYSLQGDYQRAQDTYRSALAKFPKEPRLWHDQGLCHARTKNWSQALDSFQQAVELAPENRHYIHQLGFCLARAGQVEESVACLTRVMRPAQAHYQVARMMEHLKNKELCLKHLRLALEVDPQLEDAQQMLAAIQTPSSPPSAQPVSAGVIQAQGTSAVPPGPEAPVQTQATVVPPHFDDEAPAAAVTDAKQP